MKGGATNKLPAIITPDSMYYISAHGNLDNNMFVVPPNVYIMELSAAGYPVLKDDPMLNWIAIAPESDEAKWKQYLAGAIARGSFPKKMCASTVAANVAEAAECTDAASLSIYEPGDYISNQVLTFANNSHPLMLCGLWKLPIANKTYYDLFFYNAGDSDFFETYKDRLPIATDYKALDRYFLDKPANLLKTKLFGEDSYKISLAELLYTHEILSDTSPKLIVVHSCRSAPTHIPSAALIAIPDICKKRARRLSIAARRREDSPVYLTHDFLRTVIITGLGKIHDTTFINAAVRILEQPILVDTSDVSSILTIAQSHSVTRDLFRGRELMDPSINAYITLSNSHDKAYSKIQHGGRKTVKKNKRLRQTKR